MFHMATPTVIRRRFTTDEYEQMSLAGVLAEDDRVELIEGEIVEMSPLGPQHAACVDRLNRSLQRLVGDRAIVRVQNPIRLGEYSLPQPDIALAQSRDDFYAGNHPEPEDVLLLIEVSDSSLAYDRDVKLPLYARAGIAEVWLVALLPQVVEVYRVPGADGYGEKRTVGRSQSITPIHFPDVELIVEQILG